jgi:hypothetical protein
LTASRQKASQVRKSLLLDAFLASKVVYQITNVYRTNFSHSFITAILCKETMLGLVPHHPLAKEHYQCKFHQMLSKVSGKNSQ